MGSALPGCYHDSVIGGHDIVPRGLDMFSWLISPSKSLAEGMQIAFSIGLILTTLMVVVGLVGEYSKGEWWKRKLVQRLLLPPPTDPPRRRNALRSTGRLQQ